MVKRVERPYLMRIERRGRAYWYFRRRGDKPVRLPDDPDSPEFDRAYWEARKGRTAAPAASKRTVAALVDSYVRSSRWTGLAPRTKADYRKVLDYIVDKNGGLDVGRIRRPDVIVAREANAHRARFANYVVQLLSVLYEHAADLGWSDDNPAKGVSLLRLGEGWKPWPAAAIADYRATATGNALLIFELCLGTGQRIGDVLRMRWSDIQDGAIRVKQGKTNAELWIPLTPRLGSVLDAAERRGLCIVAGSDSRPLTYRRAKYAVDEACAQGAHEQRTLHGLRHNAAAELAEAGCTDAQIAAVTGHKSLRMVAKYRAGSDQKRLAQEAMGKRGK